MNIFQQIAINRVKTNKFNLSHENKLTMNMGKLVPFLLQEIVPGDKFRVNSEIMMRLAPMLAPVMHRVDVYTHYFFVPNRLVWNEFEDFITGGRTGNLEPVAPFFYPNTVYGGNSLDNQYWNVGSLMDYMGIPPISGSVDNNVKVSSLPFRAYQMIYNEYYRDANLTDEIPLNYGSGQETQTVTHMQRLLGLRDRCWEKDYFTSALPWPQRGGEALLPMDAEVTYKDQSEIFNSGSNTPVTGDTVLGHTSDNDAGALNLRSRNPDGTVNGSTGTAVRVENIDEISNASTTINDLRKAVKLQEWLERSARGGSRYIEQILSHFGVKSSDARLQRPEYLGGGKQPIVISEVLSTVGTTAETDFVPQGNMAGHGISVGSSNRFSRRFEEHGFVIGIMSVMPRTSYQQGLPRLFTRETKFDYYWPEFAHLGEQEVKNKELLLALSGSDTNESTFGYQQRYAEYKYQPSTVHGDFRQTLDYWHLGRIINTAALNEDFVRCDPDPRIFAVTDLSIHHLYVQIFNRVDAIRPMPVFGIPSF